MRNITTGLLTACLLSASAAFTTRIHNVNGRPSLVGLRASGADDEIDVDSLGDWRVFRRNLAGLTAQESPGCTENEQVLRRQNEALANEYHSGVWAHETSTPELGGLLCRMPLEVEIYRNYKHNMIGKKLRKSLKATNGKPSSWYRKAQALVETEMQDIAESAHDGQINAETLQEEAAEMLQLYIDHQETWQEVCLVVARDQQEGTATTLVLNRPMAFKLSENLAQLVLNGAYSATTSKTRRDVVQFLAAFGKECAVYVGGPQAQEEPAIMIHGIANLPGAVEVTNGIYRDGVAAAIQGVMSGTYKPLDFRFFVGRHQYEESMLDVNVVLGKYQPVACARSLALKQCISLPKPLWHEVLELCAGELKEISSLEMLKRQDMLFEVVDEVDELDELEAYEDEDDEYYT